MTTTATVTVRTGTPADRLAVRRILDAAMLETGDVESRLEAGDVFLAVARSEPEETEEEEEESAETRSDERVLGALVCESELESNSEPELDSESPEARIAAIAVRRRHRARGIGTALVEAALEREGRLTAHFDADVRPFYESLEFAIDRIDDRRYRGVRTSY